MISFSKAYKVKKWVHQTRTEQDGEEFILIQEMNYYPCPSEDVKMQIMSQGTVCQSHSQSNLRLISLFWNIGFKLLIFSLFYDTNTGYEYGCHLPSRCSIKREREC